MPRTRRREREEARVGEKEQSSSHARVSERRKALAILPAAQPFAGRRKKRISGRRVGLSRESPTPERDAAATTSARALSRRGAHVRVSPSLGASRPVATQPASLESDLGRGWVAREGQLSRHTATARSEWSGTRSLLEASGASKERSPKGDGLRHGIAKAVPVRVRIEGSRLCPRVVLKCVAEVDGRCPDPKKRSHGSFLTKYRACVAGGLACLISRGT